MNKNWLNQVLKESGTKQAHQGSKAMARIIATFYSELVKNGVPDEQAGIITAEFAKVIVARSMGEHERKTK